MRRLLAAAVLALCAGWGAVAAERLPPEEAARFASAGVAYRGGVKLSFPGVEFGGLSGLAVRADGRTALAVSDAGHWFELGLDYDAAGLLVDARLLRSGALIDPSGRPPPTKRGGDAEALALLPDGAALVAFEQQHRLHRYPASDPPFARPPGRIAAPASLARAPANGGIEALAALPDGRLLALAEDLAAAAALTAGAPGAWGAAFLYDGGSWSALAYAREGGFLPADAALLPDGGVLVLERAFLVLAGFEARLVRLPAAALAPGARLRGQEVARFVMPGFGDNFEGLAARRDAAGRTLLYLASDDNFSPFLRSVLVMLELKD